MADSTPVSRYFGDVDKAPDPGKIMGYLDAASASSNIQMLKRMILDLLAPRPGEAILDVGCGLGNEVRTAAERVGPAGRSVGLDYSRAMVVEARRRSGGFPGRTDFCRGDSNRLPFPDGTFDAVRSERMLQHLREPRRALAEMARVAKRGGRVLDFDPDWDMMVIDSNSLDLTRRIVHAHTDGVATGWIGRHLANLFREVGLADVQVHPMATHLTSFAQASHLLELDSTLERATAAGVITADEASAWLADMKERDAAGRFFTGLASFVVVGRKP